MASRALTIPKSISLITHLQCRRYTLNPAQEYVLEFEKFFQNRCKSRDLSVSELLDHSNTFFEMSPMPTIWTLNLLLISLSKLNQWSSVVSIYSKFSAFRFDKFEPNDVTLSILIRCLCRSNNVEPGFSVLGVSIKRGIGFSSHMLGTLLDGLCKRGLMPEAVELLSRIENEGRDYSCNVVFYGTIINGFCKSRQSMKALDMLNEMLENCDGAKAEPNAYCFNIVIGGLCKEGLVDEARGLLRKMLEGSRVRPDVVSYNSLIHGMCRSGCQEQAEELLEEMVESGVSPDVYTFTFLIGLLCDEEKFDEALGLFEGMVDRGAVRNVFCYDTLITGLAKSGKWEEVLRVLTKMKDDGVRPDILTLNIILDARFKEGNAMAALHLVKVMTDKNMFLSNNVTLSSFLSRLSGSLRTEETDILCSNMENANIVADTHTLNIILNGLSSGFMMLEARKLFEEMVERGEDVDAVTYNTMLNGYCLQGEVDIAEELFNRMEMNGVLPTLVTYIILANGYLKVRRIGDTLKILKDLVCKGLRPEERIQNILKIVHAYKHELGLNYSQQGSDDKEVNHISET